MRKKKYFMIYLEEDKWSKEEKKSSENKIKFIIYKDKYWKCGEKIFLHLFNWWMEKIQRKKIVELNTDFLLYLRYKNFI